MTVIATIVQNSDGSVSINFGNGQKAAVGVVEAPDGTTVAKPRRAIKKRQRPVEDRSVADQNGDVKQMSKQRARKILNAWVPRPGRPPADVREAKAILPNWTPPAE